MVRDDRARIMLNCALPPLWHRFALFHELYHLIAHRRGESFWARTATPLSRFEYEAECFAWSAIWPDWAEATSGNPEEADGWGLNEG